MSELPCGTLRLTHSLAQEISGFSPYCSAGPYHVASSHFRVFEAAATPDGMTVCAVEVGVQLATSRSGPQPLEVFLYTSTGEPFPSGSLGLIGSTEALLGEVYRSVITVPVTAVVPSGAELVAEVRAPDGQAGEHLFIIGSNQLGESAPSYVQAPYCGAPSPITWESLDFPDMDVVINVIGTPAGVGVPAPLSPAVPVPSGSMPISTIGAALVFTVGLARARVIHEAKALPGFHLGTSSSSPNHARQTCTK